MPDPARRWRKTVESDPVYVERAVTAELLGYECDALAYPLEQYVPVAETIDVLCREWEAYLTARGGDRGPGGLAGWLGRRLARLARAAREVDELVCTGEPLGVRQGSPVRVKDWLYLAHL